MHNLIYTIWGEGDQLTALQMAVRSLVMFLIAIALLRLGGMRIYGKKSALDNVIIIMMGSVLARGIVGASPFWSTVSAAAVMIFLHKIICWLSLKNKFISRLFKGYRVKLYDKGNILWRNMARTTISEDDLMESAHLETKKTTLDDIETAFLETNGRISFIKKNGEET